MVAAARSEGQSARHLALGVADRASMKFVVNLVGHRPQYNVETATCEPALKPRSFSVVSRKSEGRPVRERPCWDWRAQGVRELKRLCLPYIVCRASGTAAITNGKNSFTREKVKARSSAPNPPANSSLPGAYVPHRRRQLTGQERNQRISAWVPVQYDRLLKTLDFRAGAIRPFVPYAKPYADLSFS